MNWFPLVDLELIFDQCHLQPGQPASAKLETQTKRTACTSRFTVT